MSGKPQSSKSSVVPWKEGFSGIGVKSCYNSLKTMPIGYFLLGTAPTTSNVKRQGCDCECEDLGAFLKIVVVPSSDARKRLKFVLKKL